MISVTKLEVVYNPVTGRWFCDSPELRGHWTVSGGGNTAQEAVAEFEWNLEGTNETLYSDPADEVEERDE